MIDPPKYASTTGERCHHRDAQAHQFLEGRTGWSRSWSRFHLWLGNMADTSYALTNNEYLAGFLGASIGLTRGLLLGIPLAFAVAIFFPIPMMGTVMATGMAITGGVLAIQDGLDFFREAQKDSAAERAGKLGDKIAQAGKAIAHGPTKVRIKAIERLKEEGAIGHRHDELEPPEEGANHRYAVMKRRQEALVNEGQGV